MMAMMIRRYLVALAVAGCLPICRWECVVILGGTRGRSPGCPGPPPRPLECQRVICNVNDLAWEYRPLPSGTLCRQTTGQCDGRGPASSGRIRSWWTDPSSSRAWAAAVSTSGARRSGRLGAPVFVFGCNGSVAQQVRIKEIDAASHDVELRVRDRFCIGVRGGQVTPGQPLELQRCDGSPAQRFATDGDAILMGTQAAGRVGREYVIEPEQGRTADRTPLVVGPRDLSDAEYFRFQAVDGSDSRPTSGFVRASNEATLDLALSKGWGTVVEVGDLVLRGRPAGRSTPGSRCAATASSRIRAPKSSSIRGRPGPAGLPDRAGQRAGHRAPPARAGRVPRRAWVNAIKVGAGPDARVLLDHLDISYWTGSAIEVADEDHGYREVCPDPRTTEFPRKPFARVVGNFLHHNHDYGVVSGGGGLCIGAGECVLPERPRRRRGLGG